jgi:hypothetical protein
MLKGLQRDQTRMTMVKNSWSLSPMTSPLRAKPCIQTDTAAMTAGRSMESSCEQDTTLRQHLAECACIVPEKRHFPGGDSVHDWLKAERHIGKQAQ